jgi:hypothetical protein
MKYNVGDIIIFQDSGLGKTNCVAIIKEIEENNKYPRIIHLIVCGRPELSKYRILEFHIKERIYQHKQKT